MADNPTGTVRTQDYFDDQFQACEPMAPIEMELMRDVVATLFAGVGSGVSGTAASRVAHDATYFYYGYAPTTATNWCIVRITRADQSIEETANMANNGTFADLDAAWPSRVGLTYA